MDRRSLVLTLVASLLVSWAPSPAVAEAPSFRRISGDDRIGTASAMARASFPEGTDTVVVARADVHVDALAGRSVAASTSGRSGWAVAERAPAVRSWNGPGTWDVGRSGMAHSDDGGRTWTKDARAVWPDGSAFAKVGMVRHGGSVYLFGIFEGRFGGVRLARVGETSLLDPAAYRYWDGRGWAAGEQAAARIVPAPVGELSVAYSAYLNRWVMTYLNEERHAVVLRTATALTGPWTGEVGVAGARRYPQLYAPYLVPGVETGRDLYFTMSRYDTYAVYLMRTSLAVRLR